MSLPAVIVIVALAVALAFALWGWSACHLAGRCDECRDRELRERRTR